MGAQGSKPQPTSPDLGRRRFLRRGVAVGAVLAAAGCAAAGRAQSPPAPDDPSKVLGDPIRPYGERSRFEQTDAPVLTIGSFWPYATTLWSYIHRSQPFDEPGSLTPDQVYALTAYLLHPNGIIGEHEVIDARTLPAVRLPNRDGFVPDPRPDVGKLAKPPKR